MPPKTPTPYGRTAYDLLSELLQHRTFVAVLLVSILALSSGAYFGAKAGYIEFHPVPRKQDEKAKATTAELMQSSPYVYWYQTLTSLDLESCKSVIAQTYNAVGANLLETPDTDKEFYAQISVNESVTSVVMCSFFPRGAVFKVYASGPDSSATKNRAGQLFQVAKDILMRQPKK